ncbi:MFS transporter [Vibrio vulnificus]
MSLLLDTVRNKNLQSIWSAVLVSTIGNFLLMLSLSVYIWRETGSNFLASAVFAVQWGAIILSPPLITYLLKRVPAARLAAYSEWTGGIVTVTIGLFVEQIWLVFILLVARGLAESISKSARIVSLKTSVPDKLLGRAASLFGTGTFIGIAFGSLLGAGLVEIFPLKWIAVIDGVTFLISGFLFYTLWKRTGSQPHATAQSEGSWRQSFSVLKSMPLLRRNFVWVILTTALLQGFHNVGRTLLPIELLDLGEQGVMLLQAIASVSFFLGALFVTVMMQDESNPWVRLPWLIALFSITLMQASLMIPIVWISLLSYALYLFVFEIAFTFCQKNLVVQCPESSMGAISSTAQSMSTLGMVVMILAGGAMSDWIGIQLTGWMFCGVFVVTLLLVELPTFLQQRNKIQLSLKEEENGQLAKERLE